MTVLLLLIVVLAALLISRRARLSELESYVAEGSFGVYVINREADKPRLEHFVRQFESSDLAQGGYTRVPAVEGKKLGLSNIVTQKALAEITEAETTGHRTKHYQLTRGAVGCYLSHMAALDMVWRSGKDIGIVFEDDAMFRPNVLAQTRAVLDRVPRDWDMVLLGFYCLKCDRNGDFNTVRRFFGTHAYAIRRAGVHKILSACQGPIQHQIDHQLSNLADSGVLRVYSARNSIVHQATHKFGTTIQIPLKTTLGVDPFADSSDATPV